ncbi:MAG: hypothetical protein ACE366_23740 [Bradymonadia bacterium]
MTLTQLARLETLATTPSAAHWSALTEALEQYSGADLDAALEAVEPLLDQWRPLDPFTEAAGELRRAPARWLEALVKGHKSPKYRIVRALSFHYSRIPSATAQRIFATDQLPNLEVFDIGESNSSTRLKAAFFQAMARADLMRQVHTLLIKEGDRIADILPKSTVFDSLRHLCLFCSHSEAYLTAPWARDLTTVQVWGLADLQLLKTVGSGLEALRTLQVQLSPYYENLAADTRAAATALASASVWDRVETLTLHSDQAEVFLALYRRLGPERPSALKTVHSVLPRGLRFVGRSGRITLEKALIHSGLTANLNTLAFTGAVSDDVIETLTAHGVQVETHPIHDTMPLRTTAVALAEGEDARRAAGDLHWTDGALFDWASDEAWEVVTGVADALALQGDADGLAELNRALETWPEAVRICPRRWLAFYHQTDRDPRLDLVRTLNITSGFVGDNAKSAGVWCEALAESPHLAGLTQIQVDTYGTQKGFLKGLTALHEAIQPRTTFVNGKQQEVRAGIADHLAKAGVLGTALPEHPFWTWAMKFTGYDALDCAEAELELEEQDTFDAMLQRDDLDHVVSLDVRLQPRLFSKAPPKVAQPRWANLRRLAVRVSYVDDPLEDLLEPMVKWLSNARPVVVVCEDEALNRALLKAGVYARAFGSTLEIEPDMKWSAVQSMLAEDRVQVSRLVKGYGDAEPLDRLAPLVQAMPERLRRCLLGLFWPLALEEFDDLDGLLEALPQLTTLQIEADRLQDHREALMEALSKAPQARRLATVMPALMHSSGARVSPPTSKQLKAMAKGVGLRPSEFLVIRPSWTPYI